MANPNMEKQRQQNKQNPQQMANKANQQAGRDQRSAATGSVVRPDQQKESPQHTPGQSSQPKNARQFQSSETNLDEEKMQVRNIDVDKDEDGFSRPRQ